MRVLITGGQGQLGRAVQAALAGHEVSAGGHAELDITDAGKVQEAVRGFRPDVVIHVAAWTDTAGCEADPARALQVNGEGTRIVAEACARAGAAMLYVSTNEVFDGEKAEPYLEEDEPNPINAYGSSKLEGERYVQSLLERYYVVRTSWLYGPGRVSFPEKIVQAAREQGRLRLVTDEVASPTLTKDLAGAIARVIQKPTWGIYHFTNQGYCSRLEWAAEILRLSGVEGVPVEPTTQREFGIPYRKAAFSALANVRGARLSIELRRWQEALAEHLQVSRSDSGAAAPATKVN